MARHPYIVPAEHDHGNAQDYGIEHLLADAGHGVREGTGEHSEQAGAGGTAADAEGDPAGAAGHAPGRGQDDANDQAGLEDFAEDDEQAGQHAATPWLSSRRR